MKHRHRMSNGEETGPPQINPDNVRQHFHMLNGVKSSTVDTQDKHTHVIDGELTGQPVESEGKHMPRYKQIAGKITSHKQEHREEGEFGIVEGYIATWDLDRGDFWGVRDQFVKGAFLESIADHLKRGRPVRFKDHHGRTIGGFPINSVHEDDRGLFGRAEVNMQVQQGREAMSLIRQGVLTDFSIGFSIDEFTEDKDVRTITKATIWEGSIVDEPMNPFANVVGFKAVVPFQDLPLADRDTAWDSDVAIGRVREFTGAEEAPTDAYKTAFLQYDRDNAELFSAYKLPIADVIEGKLTVVPRAVFAAAAVMLGARGGVDIPETDRALVIRHLEKYYVKLDMPSPFEDDDKQYFNEAAVKKLTPRELEKVLRRSGIFSKAAAKVIVSGLDGGAPNTDNEVLKNLIHDIKSIKLA